MQVVSDQTPKRHGKAVCLLLSALAVLSLSACSDEPVASGAETPNHEEAEITDDMIAVIERIMAERAGSGKVMRLNQTKTLGCLVGDLTVPDDLPSSLQQGIFASTGIYPAMARFANASTFDDKEKDFRGMSIKVFGVDGDSLWGESGQQDFLLNSHPALFAEDPAEFLAFLEATADSAMWKFFINPTHWDALAVILKGREKITDPLAIRYWSTTPYRFGPDNQVAVKYSVQSCSGTAVEMADDASGDTLLTEAMQLHLEQGEACFDFMVQMQGDPSEMPIEDASVVWDEEDSPFIPVARLTFPDQDFASPQVMQACEASTFNPWQSLQEHRPIGGINRVRRAVYAETGEFRTEQNSITR